MPAEQLENLIAELVRQHLDRPTAAPDLLQTASAVEIVGIRKCLSIKQSAATLLGLVHRIDLQPGLIEAMLDREAIAKLLNGKPDHINPASLTLTAPFRMRRRGVELKLHLGNDPTEVDRTLVQNIVTAQKLLTMVIDGKSVKEIAEDQAVSRYRMQDLLDLALLSPETLDAIAIGKQPDRLTSDYLIKTGISPIWSEQQK